MSLTDLAFRRAKPQEKTYKLSDSGGLYLLVQPNGTKLWRLKYRFAWKEKRLSFGHYPLVSIADARVIREQARKQLVVVLMFKIRAIVEHVFAHQKARLGLFVRTIGIEGAGGLERISLQAMRRRTELARRETSPSLALCDSRIVQPIVNAMRRDMFIGETT